MGHSVENVLTNESKLIHYGFPSSHYVLPFVLAMNVFIYMLMFVRISMLFHFYTNTSVSSNNNEHIFTPNCHFQVFETLKQILLIHYNPFCTFNLV